MKVSLVREPDAYAVYGFRPAEQNLEAACLIRCAMEVTAFTLPDNLLQKGNLIFTSANDASDT